jgi:hypothetical protein
MMEDPLKLPPPTDPIERVRAFARDLAYGAVSGMWPAKITQEFWEDQVLPVVNVELQSLLTGKWDSNYPALPLMDSFGYLSLISQGQNQRRYEYIYSITQPAFALLERPVVPPSVFISYSRRQSSAFGLLIECKLSSIGVKAFIDRSLDPGEDWHARLTKTVQTSNYLISLVAPGTLDSPYVREEIKWALDAKINAISVWHAGFVFSKDTVPDCPDWLEGFVTSKHAIRVQEESAEGYHDAAEKLLNRLGYVT